MEIYLVGVDGDLTAIRNGNNGKLFSVASSNAKKNYFCWGLWEGVNLHISVHIQHWRVFVVPAIAVVLFGSSNKEFSTQKKCILSEATFLDLSSNFPTIFPNFCAHQQ